MLCHKYHVAGVHNICICMNSLCGFDSPESPRLNRSPRRACNCSKTITRQTQSNLAHVDVTDFEQSCMRGMNTVVVEAAVVLTHPLLLPHKA
jgi:hypothetical protein